MTHDKISFVREYCRCRRIPYKIVKEALFIDNSQVCFSVYNLIYTELIKMIDDFCIYDDVTQDFVSISIPMF